MGRGLFERQLFGQTLILLLRDDQVVGRAREFDVWFWRQGVACWCSRRGLISVSTGLGLCWVRLKFFVFVFLIVLTYLYLLLSISLVFHLCKCYLHMLLVVPSSPFCVAHLLSLFKKQTAYLCSILHIERLRYKLSGNPLKFFRMWSIKIGLLVEPKVLHFGRTVYLSLTAQLCADLLKCTETP